MTPLPQNKQKLKETLPLGIDVTIKAIKKLLPKSAAKYNELLILESRYHEAHKLLLKDTESSRDIRQEINRIREAILQFIDKLEEKDFQKQATTNTKAQRQRGSILYRIPSKMEVGQETKCLVRIAFDKEILLEALELEDIDVIQSIRISEVMGVELIDPHEDSPFQIRSFSETIQLVYKDDFTEWIFYVKPLRIGEYRLLLKVSVVEIRDGLERKKDIVLEETVVITTEMVAETVVPFKTADYSFVTAAAADDDLAAAQSIPALYKKRKKSNIFSRLAMMLASLLLVVTVYAAIPRVQLEIDWLVATVKDNKESYEAFVKKYKSKGFGNIDSSTEVSKVILHKIKKAKLVLGKIEWQEVKKDGIKTSIEVDGIREVNETLIFTMSNFNERFIYTIDFGNGTTKALDDSLIVHVYEESGNYKVTIKSIHEGETKIVSTKFLMVADAIDTPDFINEVEF